MACQPREAEMKQFPFNPALQEPLVLRNKDCRPFHQILVCLRTLEHDLVGGALPPYDGACEHNKQDLGSVAAFAGQCIDLRRVYCCCDVAFETQLLISF